MKVIIYRAANAFLYLPTYIAKHAGIFKTTNPNIDVDFQRIDRRSGDRGARGDASAIESVIEAREDSSFIPIALCDPMAIFENQFETHREDLRVIGTLIDKPPFWAISIFERECETIEDMGDFFDSIIYYTGNFLTGNYIGRDVEGKYNLSKVEEVEFKNEIPALSDRANVNPEDRCVAVTFNIVHLAQFTQEHCRDLKVYLNYKFSNYKELDKFLTSCLVTTAEVCKKHANILENIVESIQRSILVLRTSKEIAEDVCQVVASEIAVKEDLLFQGPQADLSNTHQSEALQQFFQKNGYLLSANSIIEPQKPDKTWLIVDQAHEKRYLLEKERDQFCIYKSSDSLTRTELSWIVSQFNSEDFYPGSLTTPKDNWQKSIDTRFSSAPWPPEKIEGFKETYHTIVSNQFANKAQETITKEISGISFQEIKKDFAIHKKTYHRTASIASVVVALFVLTLFWFPEWPVKFEISDYKLPASVSFVLILIVFWTWKQLRSIPVILIILAIIVTIIICGITHYVFKESIGTLIIDLMKSLIVTGIIAGIVALLKIKGIRERLGKLSGILTRKQ